MDDFDIDTDDPAPTMTAPDCRHPDVVVQLTGCDGGTGAIMARVGDALREHGHTDDANEYRNNVLFVGNYNDVLRYTMSFVTVQ